MTHSPAPDTLYLAGVAEHRCCWDHKIEINGEGVADVRDGFQNLFLAAPDMLVALKAVIEYDNDMYKADSYYAMNADLRDLIESAISKAEPNEIK